jgi:hypothetical protein
MDNIIFECHCGIEILFEKRVEHDFICLSCITCLKLFENKKKLLRHQRDTVQCNIYKNKTFICSGCDRKFINVDKYNNHIKICVPLLQKTIQNLTETIQILRNEITARIVNSHDF